MTSTSPPNQTDLTTHLDDCIGSVLRIRHFLLAQGYKPSQTVIILQDNRSAILLEQNGIMSSTKRTKHINVRYYFVKSRIDAGEVIVQWYSGEKLEGDFFSKPLCRSKFLRFRRKIMNHKKPDPKMSSKDKYHKFHEPDDKKDTALVSVGMNKTMKCGYWSKKPGQKAKYLSLPARKPSRKGPIRSKIRKTYNKKPIRKRDLLNNQRTNEVNNRCSYKAKLSNPRKNPCKMIPKNRGNLTKLGRTKGPSKIWSRPTMPYKVHIQYDRTRNFIGHPSNNINWARVVNRKTYNALTNELMEDLNVNHEVAMEVLMGI